MTVFGIVGSAGLGGLLTKWLDFKVITRKQSDSVAMTLVEKMQARIENLEVKADRDKAICDANLSVMRHRINNLSSSFDGLLLLIEMAPEKASQFVAEIKRRRAEQAMQEATEKSTVMAKTVDAARGIGGHDGD